jgi:hypothetical protein
VLRVNVGAWLIVSAAVVAGCSGERGGQGDSPLCSEAVSHAQQCLGDPSIGAAGCTEDKAQQILAQSCEDMTATAGKADGCLPWMWWACTSSESTNKASTWWVRVQPCRDDICDGIIGDTSCTKVVIETGKHKQVAVAVTRDGGNAKFENLDLPDGSYFVKVLHRDGSVAEEMVAANGEYGLTGRAPAEHKIKLEGGKADDLEIYVTQKESDALRTCARIDGSLKSSCGSKAMSTEQTEWAWFVRLENTSEQGTAQIIRPFESTKGNDYTFLKVLPGSWQIIFLEMDVPQYRQKPNPDYDELVNSYATGRKVQGPKIDVKASDVDQELTQPMASWKHEQCE